MLYFRERVEDWINKYQMADGKINNDQEKQTQRVQGVKIH